MLSHLSSALSLLGKELRLVHFDRVCCLGETLF